MIHHGMNMGSMFIMFPTSLRTGNGQRMVNPFMANSMFFFLMEQIHGFIIIAGIIEVIIHNDIMA